jgi:hypothetical protein
VPSLQKQLQTALIIFVTFINLTLSVSRPQPPLISLLTSACMFSRHRQISHQFPAFASTVENGTTYISVFLRQPSNFAGYKLLFQLSMFASIISWDPSKHFSENTKINKRGFFLFSTKVKQWITSSQPSVQCSLSLRSRRLVRAIIKIRIA